MKILEDISYENNENLYQENQLEHTQEGSEAKQEINFENTPEKNLKKMSQEFKLTKGKNNSIIIFDVQSKNIKENKISNLNNSNENLKEMDEGRKQNILVQLKNKDIQIIEDSVQLSQTRVENENIKKRNHQKIQNYFARNQERNKLSHKSKVNVLSFCRYLFISSEFDKEKTA